LVLVRRFDVFLDGYEAFTALADAIRDEPEWATTLYVVPIELDERAASAN
jgi:hypothetical protein